jgi:formate-dependent nitrite reductase membrane component NrfD
MVSLLGWLLAMGTQNVESKEALAYLCSHFTVWIWIAFIFAMAIPMVVYVKSLITQKELSSFEFYITSLGAVVGVFVLKYVVVYLGQLEYLVK